MSQYWLQGFTFLASIPVEHTDVKLRSYSGHEIPVIGEAKVQVAYRDQEAVLPAVITGNDGPVLMGRNWLSVWKLDWGQIKRISLEPASSCTFEAQRKRSATVF